MSSQKSLFLDTATQIARHWHSPPTHDEISEQLSGCRLFCSRYVKCQYKATLLDSLIKLHNLRLRSADLFEAIQKATEGRYFEEAGGKLTAGVLARIVDIAYWISRQYETFDEQVGRLRDLIEDGWEVLFEDSLELPLIDETGCVYAEGDPVKGESGAYRPMRISCTKDKPPECRIQHFWEDHRIQLETLAKMKIEVIKATPKDTVELESVKENAQAIADRISPSGKRCTSTLSDAIICIEATHCPEPAAVHSINRKHFSPLGEILGIECRP
ncbi:MAG: hypothetical protein A2Z25_00725 [Planctomycetes bacterium RBG_16_55_9]|nr:MAG: hypothetical protein A2Z25_00725 [Planctomycetes bacterium RBG_16_55_9]